MKSIAEMLESLFSLEQDELTHWERDFVRTIRGIYNGDTTFLSPMRVQVIEKLYRKYCL